MNQRESQVQETSDFYFKNYPVPSSSEEDYIYSTSRNTEIQKSGNIFSTIIQFQFGLFQISI